MKKFKLYWCDESTYIVEGVDINDACKNFTSSDLLSLDSYEELKEPILKKRMYRVEVATPENWEKCHKVIIIIAESVNEVFERLKRYTKPNEGVYQMCRDFTDCNLPQPVWDHFNGGYKSLEHGDTWRQEGVEQLKASITDEIDYSTGYV